jgi:FKBP-type peptidyl-prolyl cis-trans isomerase
LKLQYNTFTVSPAAVDIALSLMRVGETFRFLIPSSLGFGSYGAGPLPQNSILDLELTIVNSYTEEDENAFELQAIEDSLAVNNMTEFVYYPDFGIYYKEIVPGTGPDIIDGDQLNISYVGNYFGGDQFDSSSSFVFTVGGSLVIKGLGDGVRLMKKGGRGVLILPSGKAYGGSTLVIPRQLNNNIFPYSILEFDITIL